MAKLNQPIDIGVITIREDECEAILDRLPSTSKLVLQQLRLAGIMPSVFTVPQGPLTGRFGAFVVPSKR